MPGHLPDTGSGRIHVGVGASFHPVVQPGSSLDGAAIGRSVQSVDCEGRRDGVDNLRLHDLNPVCAGLVKDPAEHLWN
jgi:hypothetical protein